jgi:hypothetical protein
MSWASEGQIGSLKYQCGFCGSVVATDKGFHHRNGQRKIYPCPHCEQPSYFDSTTGTQTPGVSPGNTVAHLPQALGALYDEARRCISVNAFTASVLACRKLLMHIAVEQKAEEGKSFIHYVEYLAAAGYVPPNGKGWVDHIRKKGNEANHDIVLMGREDAIELVAFSEMLLKFIYEFPARVPQA